MSVARVGPAGLPRLVWALGLVSFLVDVHSEAILALLPLFVAETLAAGALGVGLMEGAADLAGSGLRIWAGRLSDRAGRRKPWAVGGYAVSTLAKGVWALAQGPLGAIALRVADRVGKGLRSAPRDAMIADAVPPEARGAAFGLHRTLDTAGAVVGSGLAFLLLTWGLATRSVMLLAAVPGVLAVLALVVFVREPPRRPRDPAAPAAPGAGGAPAPAGLPSRIDLPRFLVLEALFGVAHASYAFFLLRARDLGAAAATLPLLYLGSNLVYAAVPLPLGRLADRFGRLRVLAGGYAVFAAACALAALAQGIDAALLASFACLGAASGVVEATPRAVVAEALGPERRGTALGLHHGVTGFSAVLSGLLFGLLWGAWGPAAVFLAAAALAACCVAALPLVLRPAPR